ncbi:autotransporter outer membrane beta-barrel domain-containing protein [Pseudomonas aeruginosa]|uniref:autotransporter family protein n=1 Tax=Pseudomonas aeruginosa TaxID=287 RepID=UPI000F5403E8|nr:autotransporter outer membrane beta-barrel domain-containing protein [Pseudomonas aeruginosa]RQJ19381.1 autotransporter domain-containing protein [Pseudomonas aeruginosa]
MIPTYRKTLLALAIAGAALPSHAATLQLSDTGLRIENTRYADSLEITGAFTGSDLPEDADAIYINTATFEQNLVLNANIEANGNDISGVDFMIDGPLGSENRIKGDLVNQGTITLTGQAGSAILLDTFTTIEGDLRNEGTLSVTGEPYLEPSEGAGDRDEMDTAQALDFGDSAVILGNLVNAASGQILAEGREAIAINLEGGLIGGKLVNQGLIQAIGLDAVAIDATEYEGDFVDLAGIENSGRIIAQGEGARALLLDGVSFTGSDAQVINSGLIEATDSAIDIQVVDLDNADTLVIRNSGTLTSQDEAIDAASATVPVHLEWDAGTINGNLIGLSSIAINGDATFNGTDASTDGANIRLKDSGWIDVGSDAPGSSAHLEFGQPHTTIDGNLNVEGNSSLGLSLSSATNPDTAVVAVSGTAQFAKGSQIQLATQGDDFKAQGTTYTLIQAGTLQDEGVSVTSRSALLNVDTYSSGDNRIVARVSTKNQGEVGEVIGQVGGSANARHAGAAFSQVVTGLAQDDPSDPVFQAYVNASQDPAALKTLAEQLTPEVNGGATQAATSGQTLVGNVTGNRTSSLRGASSGDVLQETGVWAQALYSDANQDLRDGVAGFNAYSRGIAIGADGKLNDQITLGLAYSFLHTGVNSDGGNTTDVDGNALTLYGGFEQGNYFVDANLSYGINDNESKRHIAGTTAKGDYDSNVLGASLVGGYTYRLSDRFLVEPRLAARYTWVDIDGYREKGSSAALRVEDQRYEVAELGGGVRVAGNFPFGRGNLQPQLRLMAYHDFAADEAKSTSTFMLGGTPFVTQGARSVRNSYEAGIGADYRLGAVTLGLSYDYVGKSDFNADTFTAKVRYDF